jgi:anaerobic selenocysteine-containing dehydrogenase
MRVMNTSAMTPRAVITIHPAVLTDQWQRCCGLENGNAPARSASHTTSTAFVQSIGSSVSGAAPPLRLS